MSSSLATDPDPGEAPVGSMDWPILEIRERMLLRWLVPSPPPSLEVVICSSMEWVRLRTLPLRSLVSTGGGVSGLEDTKTISVILLTMVLGGFPLSTD